jgi:hypothetical protein
MGLVRPSFDDVRRLLARGEDKKRYEGTAGMQSAATNVADYLDEVPASRRETLVKWRPASGRLLTQAGASRRRKKLAALLAIMKRLRGDGRRQLAISEAHLRRVRKALPP